MTVSIHDVRREDLDAITEMERVSFSDPWTRGMFASHLTTADGNIFLVADDNGRIVGYAMSRTVIDESELLNIAVTAERRGQGIGTELLNAVIERCRRAGAFDMWLEVRTSNTGARALYASHGFVAVGLRKRYYHSPREDAIVLRTDLRMPARNDSVTNPVFGFTAERVERILSPATHFPRQETK